MNRILIALALVLSAAVAVPAVAHQGKSKSNGKRPDVIALPPGFQPEGITTAKRHTFFVGSRTTGAIYKGSLRSGKGDTLVEGGGSKQATGLKVDRYGRLFVSGAGSKAIRIYNARTGGLLRTYPVPEAGFINDVIVTRRGAYFTDSGVAQLYFIPFGSGGALGDLKPIPLTGDLEYDTDPQTFDLNGIEAARGGKQLISVQSHTGKLFTIDPATGVTKEIVLDEAVTNGDGLLRKGRKLYVVRNQNNLVAVVKLAGDLASGDYGRELTRKEFDVPTTIARSGGRNYVVNAKFGSASPTTDSYEVVKVPKK
jgi:streptogramin lyase